MRQHLQKLCDLCLSNTAGCHPDRIHQECGISADFHCWHGSVATVNAWPHYCCAVPLPTSDMQAQCLYRDLSRSQATHANETLDRADLADLAVHTASRVRHQQQCDHYPRVSDESTRILDHFHTIFKCICCHCRGAGVPHSAAHPAVLAAHPPTPPNSIQQMCLHQPTARSAHSAVRTQRSRQATTTTAATTVAVAARGSHSCAIAGCLAAATIVQQWQLLGACARVKASCTS